MSGTWRTISKPLKTAAILARLLTVDGTGSGLDADLLDGQHGSYYRDAGNINAGTLAVARGGTGVASYAVGDVLYASGTTTLSKLAIGAVNRVLTSSGSAPQWSNNLILSGAGGVSRADSQIEAISPGAGGHALIAIFQQETPAVSGPFEEGAISYQLKNAAGTIVQSTSISSMWCSSAHASTGFTMARMNVTCNGGVTGEVQQRWYGGNGISFFASDDTSTYAPGNQILRNYGSYIGNNGIRELGLVRVEGTAIPSSAAGVGAELGESGGTSFLQSYNRTSSAFAPLSINASLITLDQGPIILARESLTTGGFRVEGATVPASATGPGLEFGYSSGGSTAYFQGYNRTGSVFIPLAITATSIDLTISGTSKLTLASSTLTFADAVNIVLNATTGTKIGTATTQKLSLWNATPIVQPSSTGETTGWTTGGGSAATSTDTYTGNTGSKAYTVNDLVKHLKNTGILAAS